jgi:hypothetical protein
MQARPFLPRRFRRAKTRRSLHYFAVAVVLTGMVVALVFASGRSVGPAKVHTIDPRLGLLIAIPAMAARTG